MECSNKSHNVSHYLHCLFLRFLHNKKRLKLLIFELFMALLNAVVLVKNRHMDMPRLHDTNAQCYVQLNHHIVAVIVIF